MKTITKIIYPVLVALGVACFALSATAQGLKPPPDGGYANRNTAEGTDALFSLTTGAENTAIGWRALWKNNTGMNNTAIGRATLAANTSGRENTAVGEDALLSNNSDTANDNTAIGAAALISNTTGAANTAVGEIALFTNIAGSFNTAIGPAAGDQITGDWNIDIANGGVAGEGNTIRIGDFHQTATYITGIFFATTGSTTTLPVIVDENGQLGTTASSERFKTAIKPMDNSSEVILGLKPVTFHYKNDTTGTPQFGLVAEDVAKVNPDLVVRGKDGKIFTVRYDAVNAMLLNEFLKAHHQIEEQQKEIEALRALIQKVSDKVGMTKPAPQMVLNNQ